MVTQQLALGVGANGALIDVSSFVVGPEGVQYSWGRQDEFRDPNPGQLSFMLENQDGRFTPGNSSSPLATLLTEGTAACWNFNGRLVAGEVSAIGFAGTEDQWGRVSITVGDAFYVANRTILPSSLATGIAQNAASWYWPMNEAVGATSAAEFNGIGSALSPTAGTAFAFGASGPNGDTQLAVSSTGAAQGQFTGTVRPAQPYLTNAATVVPAWIGFWFTPDASGHSQVKVDVWQPAINHYPTITCTAGTITVSLGTGTGSSSGTFNVPTPGQPYHVEVQVTTSPYVANVYVNGIYLGQLTYTGGIVVGGGSCQLTLTFGDGVASAVQTISHLTFANSQLFEGFASLPTSLGNRLQAIAAAVPQITIGTIDAAVSAAPIDVQSTSQGNCWSLMCDLLRTEQGHLYASTSGTLTAPSTVVNLRARTRPSTVTAAATFDAATEIEGVPQFVHDITNMYSAMTASGPSRAATVFDRTLTSRAGSATGSESVVLQNSTDLQMWAQDRLIRGKNSQLRVVSITIETRTTPTNRLSDLLALTAGDRVRVANLPTAGLGFTQWDGWFLGATEVHNYLSDAFTLYLAPVLAPPSVYDTDRLAAGNGSLTLQTSMLAGDTSMVVIPRDTLTFLDSSQVPYVVQIEQEQVIVTACTAYSGTPGTSQTATITRGANGTTAAAHSSSTATVDYVSPATYAF